MAVSVRPLSRSLETAPTTVPTYLGAGPQSRHAIALATVALCMTGVAGVATASGPEASDYLAAAQLLPGNLEGLVRNETVEPHWIAHTGTFWYRRDGERGPEFVVVTAAGLKSPAFDHGAVAQAIDASLGRPAGATLPTKLANARLSDDLSVLAASVDGRAVECHLKPVSCRTTVLPRADPALLLSPDGRQAAFVREDNLWIRDTETGRERRLTSDGAAFYSWGKLPDDMPLTILRQKTGFAVPPYSTFWSLDGKYLIAPRVDERKVAVDPFVEWVPSDGARRPVYHEVRSSIAGDRGTLELTYSMFDLGRGLQVAISLPEGYEPSVEDGFVQGWSTSRGQAFLLARTVDFKSMAVFRLDLGSGRLTKVLEDSSATRVDTNTHIYSRANVRLLGDGAEILWYSTRSGWGHFYLYDAQSGRLENAVTGGNFGVFDIQLLDEKRREVYFSAGGREPGRDPYYRHLYRANLDGHGSIQLLTPPNADHEYEGGLSPLIMTIYGIASPSTLIEPRAGVFIDTWSTVDTPPQSVLRSTRDGHVIAELERADPSRLYAAGWRVPTRERVKAADGVTDLYAVYYAPYGAASGGRPVIDAAYGGPQMDVTPHNFRQAHQSTTPIGAASLARLGFAVLTVDGRGTTSRSRAFSDAGYPEFTQIGIDDHIAAIRELAQRHAEIDPGRAGIYGRSWGGTFAAQAILSRPEFYQVAVSGAGIYDYAASYPVQAYLGMPVYADGSRFRSRPDEAPANWAKFEVVGLADRLKGHLMIVYGDLDENVPPHQAFRLVDALTRANKSYDLLYLPGRTHAGSSDGYMLKRTWDYFIEHLAGQRPVPDLAIDSRRVSPNF
jgi:dipeptidyl-peptidase 4